MYGEKGYDIVNFLDNWLENINCVAIIVIVYLIRYCLLYYSTNFNICGIGFQFEIFANYHELYM